MDDFAESPATPSVVRVFFKGARQYWSLALCIIECLAVCHVGSCVYRVLHAHDPFAALVKQCPLTLKCEATQACQVFVINMNGAIIRR